MRIWTEKNIHLRNPLRDTSVYHFICDLLYRVAPEERAELPENLSFSLLRMVVPLPVLQYCCASLGDLVREPRTEHTA